MTAEPRCSFCDKSAGEVRLFSGRRSAGSQLDAPFICEECVRSLGTPGEADLLSLIGARLRRGLHDQAFVRGLATQFIEYGNELVCERGDDEYEPMVGFGERWLALLDHQELDFVAAEALESDIVARRDDAPAWAQIAGHYSTWLRARQLERRP